MSKNMSDPTASPRPDIDTDPKAILASLERLYPGVYVYHREIAWEIADAIKAIKAQERTVLALELKLEEAHAQRKDPPPTPA